MFIVRKRGIVQILDGGSIIATPFLDIDSLVVNPSGGGDERGLLSIAFHPDYDSNGFFFVEYINNSSDTVIARYQVSGDPNVANAGSALIVLGMNERVFPRYILPDAFLSDAVRRRLNYVPGGRIAVRDDDHEEEKLLFELLLGSLGWQVTAARSADDELERFDPSATDVILTDIGLPEMDGYELLALMRDRTERHIPAVAITGYGAAEVQDRASGAGFDGFLTKPFQLATLLELLHAIGQRKK